MTCVHSADSKKNYTYSYPQYFQALKEYSPDEAKVIRSSQISRIHATELVPGDIISVAVGDKIPADCRVISVSSSSFRVDQAILTGESTSVNKSIESIADMKAVKQDMTNMLFSASSETRISLLKLTCIWTGYYRGQWDRNRCRCIYGPKDRHG